MVIQEASPSSLEPCNDLLVCRTMRDDRFEWDDVKAKANAAKHNSHLILRGWLSITRLLFKSLTTNKSMRIVSKQPVLRRGYYLSLLQLNEMAGSASSLPEGQRHMDAKNLKAALTLAQSVTDDEIIAAARSDPDNLR
jgi:hypothetical protein